MSGPSIVPPSLTPKRSTRSESLQELLRGAATMLRLAAQVGEAGVGAGEEVVVDAQRAGWSG